MSSDPEDFHVVAIHPDKGRGRRLTPYPGWGVAGYVYGEPIDSAIKSERLVLSESITSELALGMLVKQRVDLLIENEPVVVDLAAPAWLEQRH